MDREEFRKLPYFLVEPTEGRIVPLLPFFEKGEFFIPFAVKDEKIVLIKAAEANSGNFISKEPANADLDFHLPLLELIIQRITWPRPLYIMQTIVSDVINLGAGLEKYRLFQSHPDRLAAAFLVATELEFLFFNIRSLYDQLQKIIKDIWGKTTLRDTALAKKGLPDSFRDVILTGDQDNIRSIDEIKVRYGLPEQIATFYHTQGHFFKLCRAIRDDMVHGGKSISKSPIYPLNEGFAVKVTDFPYSQFDCWKPEHLKSNNLGDLRTLIAYIIRHIIIATSDYSNSLVSCIQLAEPISPEWHIYTRNPFTVHLHRLDTYIQRPWQFEFNNHMGAAQPPAES